jgi:hypothetical protein
MEKLDGAFTWIADGEVQALKGKSPEKMGKGGFILSAANNHSFVAVNELLKVGAEVYRINGSRVDAPTGSFYIPNKGKSGEWLMKNASSLGADLLATDMKTTEDMIRVNPSRIALWDAYGGSMASGWMRWIMEQYHFNVELLYAQEIDKGNLNNKYDVILFVGGAMPSLQGSGRSFGGPKPEDTPEAFRKTIGNISVDKSIPELKKFMEAGGRILTIGSSTSLAYHLKLPVSNALVEMNNGKERELPNEKFYIPGSLMQITIDNDAKAAWGMKKTADVYFDDSPVFHIAPGAQTAGSIKPLAWFASEKTLRSGWAWGQSYLKDGIAAFAATVGKGTLFAFGPEISFRAQTHGSFKFIFNQLYQ